MKLIAKGAEANLYRVDEGLVKHRIKKNYRIKELDERLRRLRTKREAKLLENAKRVGVKVPRIFKTDLKDNKIFMEYIDGELVKDVFETASEEKIGWTARKIGETISRLHSSNIVHNDLTTSNMLLRGDEVFFIDFGLGTTSTRVEDKAMDLVVLKKSLMAAHTSKFDLVWGIILDSYKTKQLKDILGRMKNIEKRVRYA
ncbi:MAG: KEOPS complex kinase/ATPase Bud32 [Candidatus Altiarchaeota archaeon]|nr:KEOPS complex kinase/ATPase Bud32 [Candidatus Altiarchaeota archaeon]